VQGSGRRVVSAPATWWVPWVLWLWEMLQSRAMVRVTCLAVMIYSLGYAGWRTWLEDDVD